MPAADALAGIRVLVTRPEPQAGGLVELVRRAGGEPVLFPTIEISPVEPPPAQVERLAACDMAIFVSPNAVAHGYRVVQTAATAVRRLVAVGPSTKRALEEAGVRGILSPVDGASTENLLEEPFLANVEDLGITIVRGQEGREALGESLEARGARVSYLECYRRDIPEGRGPDALVREIARGGGPLVISVTSVAGLSNLLAIIPAAHRDRLVSRPLAVIGERQRSAALSNGWLGPILESKAGDRHIVQAIADWRGAVLNRGGNSLW